jgi:hypothetical protein
MAPSAVDIAELQGFEQAEPERLCQIITPVGNGHNS